MFFIFHAYYQHFYREFKDHKKVLYAYLDTEDYRDRNEKELCELKKKEDAKAAVKREAATK